MQGKTKVIIWLSMTMETRISKIRKETVEERVQEMGEGRLGPAS